MEHKGMAMSQDMMDMMAGMPGWLVALEIMALALVTILLFVGFNLKNRYENSYRYRTFDLLRIPGLASMVKSRRFQFFLQAPLVLLFTFIILAGLVGNQLTSRNIAPLLTWTVWWATLIFIILMAGKFWCLICPWNAIAQWVERLSPWRRKSAMLSLNRRWPSGWRNIYLATGLFLGLTWLELGYGITFSPRATAYLGLLMIVMAVVSILVFERQSFCRYTCLVGRVSGMYALFSPLEVRSRDREICRSCHGRDCYAGNERGYACPTFQYLGAMQSNTYCILCSECVKTCPHDNVAVNARPFGADLVDHTKGQADEAYLVIVMLCMTLFHGLTMTPAWSSILDAIKQNTGSGELSAFSFGMVGVLIIPAALYTGVIALTRSDDLSNRWTVRRKWITLAYPLLPIALFYHLAHNAGHFFMEGPKLLVLASDPFGWDWNLFGTAYRDPAPWLTMSSIWWIQAGLILVGQAAGVALLIGITRRLFPERRQALPVQVPVMLFMMVCSCLNVWLTAQPMMMRTGM